MQSYDKYKDSGVDWIGQIPEHWNCAQIKKMLLIKNGFDYKNIETSNEGYPVIGSGGQFAYASSYLYDGEVVLLGRKGTIDRPLYFNGKFWTIDTMFYGIPKKGFSGKFLYYNSTTIPFKKYATSTALPSMTKKDLYLIYLTAPPYSEQQAIAAYLDKETGKLDDAVEKLERMVEVLKERKQLIISKAVTRGLDDSVTLKDSGVEWIGQIPEHWKINRFKAIFTLSTGISFTKAELVDHGQPVISYGQVHSNLNKIAKANLSLIKYIPQELTINKQKSYCSPNDFIFADTSEDFEGCGNNYYNDSELSLFAGSHTILAKPRCNIDGKYLAYLFSTSLWRQQIRSSVNGVKVFSITQSILKGTSVILPPKLEQKAIAAYLDERVGKLDEAIEKQQSMIELLKERRQILISDVVTGKIKVA